MSGLSGMSSIDVSDDAITIGATVTNSQLAWHPVVRDRYPGAVGSDPLWRHHTDPQHGDGCRQHPAADALLVFQRCSCVVQPQTARVRLRCARRLQPRTRRAGRQRTLHCDASIRHVRGDGRSRCRRSHGAGRWHYAFDSVWRVPPCPWRHAARRSRAGARRTDHPHRHSTTCRRRGARTISR